jgi:hypothetical protein
MRKMVIHSRIPGNILIEQAGQAIVIWILCLGVIMGFCALAMDVGLAFRSSRMAQTAADAAAVAGSEETTNADLSSVAQQAATQNGVTNGVGGAVVTVNNPPTLGQHASNSAYVEVIVQVPVSTVFMGFVTGNSMMTVAARAVASTAPAANCIYALAPTGTNVTLSNSGKLTSSSCGVMSDSSSPTAVSSTGSSALNAKSIGIVGSYTIANAGTISPTPITGISAVSDPMAGLSPPTYTASSCTADPLSHYSNGGSSYSVGPGSTYSTTQGSNLVCYTSLTLGSNGDTVDILPGIYVITGPMTFNSGTNTGGTGVMFYLVGALASVTIQNGATVNLTAATSGTYSGVVFYQDRLDLNAASIEGGASSVIDGVLYFPDAALTVGNGTTTNIETPMIAQTITFLGGTNFTNSQYANTPLVTPKLVE